MGKKAKRGQRVRLDSAAEGGKRVCFFESDLEEENVDMRREEERNSLRKRRPYDTHMHVYTYIYICKPAHKNIVKLHIKIIVIAYIHFRPEHRYAHHTLAVNTLKKQAQSTNAIYVIISYFL